MRHTWQALVNDTKVCIEALVVISPVWRNSGVNGMLLGCIAEHVKCTVNWT